MHTDRRTSNKRTNGQTGWRAKGAGKKSEISVMLAAGHHCVRSVNDMRINFTT